VRLGARLRALEDRAGAARRARALCKICGGDGKFNARSVLGDKPESDEPPEPCPGCGKVKLLRIIVPRCERIAPNTIPLAIVGKPEEDG
jgi:hypothetical protein